jgi:predicted nucleotidyltransferase
MASEAQSVRTDIDSRSAEIAQLCAQFSVRRLELFGSAASGPFDPQRSDLDFVVEFNSDPHLSPFEQYFGLKEALEALFGRATDLVMAGASRNPYFLASLNRTRRLLYAA